MEVKKLKVREDGRKGRELEDVDKENKREAKNEREKKSSQERGKGAEIDTGT